jgi:hypothetical protein
MNKIKKQPLMSLDNFQQITSQPLPTAEDLFTILDKFHSVLYDAFGYSLVRSRESLKNTHNKKASKWARPQFIRFYVHDFLSQKGIKAQLVDENDKIQENELTFDPRVLPNNGIAGTVGGYKYIVLKIFNGGLPVPVADSRKYYYSQAHLQGYKLTLPGFPVHANLHTLKPNLIYIWDIVVNHVNLYLAIPHSYLAYATTKLTLIPNPITTMKPIETEEQIDTKEITTIEAEKNK